MIYLGFSSLIQNWTFLHRLLCTDFFRVTTYSTLCAHDKSLVSLPERYIITNVVPFLKEKNILCRKVIFINIHLLESPVIWPMVCPASNCLCIWLCFCFLVKVSDQIRDSMANPSSDLSHFTSLSYSVLITTFISVIGGGFFLASSIFLEEDKHKMQTTLKRKPLTTFPNPKALTHFRNPSALSNDTYSLAQPHPIPIGCLYKGTYLFP